MATENELGELPTPEELVSALRATARLSKGKSIGTAVDALVEAGSVRPEAAQHLKLMTVYAQDRVKGISAGHVTTGNTKAIDERYFEGSPEELKEARTSARQGARKEYQESTPKEYQPIIEAAFRSQPGKEMVYSALRRQLRTGKIPETERIRERVKEVGLDREFGGKLRKAPVVEEPDVRPGVAGLKILAGGPGAGSMRIRGQQEKPTFGVGTLHGESEGDMALFEGLKVPGEALPAESSISARGQMSPAFVKKAKEPVPEVSRLTGRVSGNLFDRLRAMANNENLSAEQRLIARRMYTYLANKQNAEVEKFGKREYAKRGPKPVPRVMETKPEFIESLGKVASRKVAVLARPSAASQSAAQKRQDIDEKAAVEFIHPKSSEQIASDEAARVEQLVGQMGRGRAFSPKVKDAFSKAYRRIATENPNFSKAKINRLALMEVVPDYASYLKRNLPSIREAKARAPRVAAERPLSKLPTPLPRTSRLTAEAGGVV